MGMTRCRTCVMPTTRPDTYFDGSGECSACVSYRNRSSVDWGARKLELVRLLERHDGRVIVPSSGGKDSTYQVLTLLELGADVTVVTATTCDLSEIGRANIDNLSRYATTIEVTPNRKVRAKLNRIALNMVGDCSWPEHVLINCVPFRVAMERGIPLIFYGEAPLREYGSPPGLEEQTVMTKRWISEFGGQLGLRPSDLVGTDGITARDMAEYTMPSIDNMRDVTAFWLGQFVGPWDSERNAMEATAKGMIWLLPTPANRWAFENQDNLQTGAHDFFCWLKYGFGRGCAQASVEIRAGATDRSAALEWVRHNDGLFPLTYLGVSLDSILNRINMGRDEFLCACNRFMNKDLFVEDSVEWGQHLTLKEFS